MPAQLPAIALICLLLYLEEAGLPLPIAPGEVVLLGAGLLVASRPDLVFIVVPLAYAAVLGGVLTAYSWAQWIGPQRLRALAKRLHAGGPYDRAAGRLRAATPVQIAISRLLPGLRVYTSLVAGAVGLGRRRFFGGVVPASALWVLIFTGLGFFVGVPVERLISRLAVYAIGIVFIVVVAVIWVFAARRLPPARVADSVPESPHGWRIAAALGIDLASVLAVICLLSALSVLARGDIDDLVFAAGIFAVLSLVYLCVARYTVGFTLGEALLDIRYHPPRIPALRPGNQG